MTTVSRGKSYKIEAMPKESNADSRVLYDTMKTELHNRSQKRSVKLD